MRIPSMMAALGVCLGGTLAISQHSSPKRTTLLDQVLPSTVVVHHVKGGRLDFSPGQAIGRHLHPAPVVGIVTRGSFVFEVVGQPSRTLNSGDAFYEPAQTVIERFDNASTTEPATLHAFYLLERADEPEIEVLPE